MKAITILLCFVVYSSYSQSDIGGSNCNLNNLKTICGKLNEVNGYFTSNDASCCHDNKLTLYYQFIPDQNLRIGMSPYNSILLAAYSLPSNTSPINSSYKLYGPFDPHENYVDLINDGLISPSASDAVSASTHYVTDSILQGKVYVVAFTVYSCSGYINIQTPRPYTEGIDFLTCFPVGIDCENCIPKFQPVDDRYVVSAWVKELEASTEGALNYENAKLIVTSGGNVKTFHPSGQIIDGWQRIEGIIQTNSLGNLKMELIMDDGIAYFDDIRVSPFDGSMITYVYDPITLRLMAEMDERNYAKIYEYDEEGKLVRVKKETEKGIMTIQENRENSSTND